jgi:NitT/TauT family transport system ATP-binding protein
MPVEFINTPLPDIIELKNISLKYDDADHYIIKDLNLLIEDKPDQGQFIVLLGKSGCGKSTLLRFIAGLQKPTSGEVLLYGKPRTDEKIAMVFQSYSSFPWLTVLENVEMSLKFAGVSKKERAARAMEMVQLVGLDGHEKKFAKSPQLSGGQLQRVAIARSLLANPQILIFDEPFCSLDINTRLAMQDLLRDIWMKFQSTIIFVTHDIAEAVYLGDDVYILRTNPASIEEAIKIDLPVNRSRSIKRDPRFIRLVYEIEDKMIKY